LIVGLGNPGREYLRSRHNVGFLCVDGLTKRWGFAFGRQRARAEVADGNFRGQRVILAEPQTYMNNSGESVRGLTRMYGIEPNNLLVVYDDMDLPFGRIRLRDQGSSGGHRGIQSIIDSLGTNQFPRLRIGVGRPPAGAEPIDHVLKSFSLSEMTELAVILNRVAGGIELFLTDGLVAAMNVLNTVPKPAAPTSELSQPPR
jgi:PTH1 family peptidyl-tRNA hydrolase